MDRGSSCTKYESIFSISFVYSFKCYFGLGIYKTIPKDAKLKMEIAVNNKDISHIKKGGKAKFRFLAFPYKEYDNIEKSSVVSAKFLYKPFENSGKKMLLLEKEELIIKEKEGKNNANNDYETKSNTFKFLIKESARLENFNKSYRVFYEEMKTRFEKGNISYDDFMKIKKDYRTVEEELIKTQIELEKFIVNEKE